MAYDTKHSKVAADAVVVLEIEVVRVCQYDSFAVIIIIINIFAKRHKAVTSEALEAVGCVC